MRTSSLIISVVAAVVVASASVFGADLRVNLELERECADYRLKVAEFHAAERKSPDGPEAERLRYEVGEQGIVLTKKISLLAPEECELVKLLGPPIGTSGPATGQPKVGVTHHYYGRVPGEYVQFYFEDGNLKRTGILAAFVGR